jgi:hypothetical protein
MRPEVRDTTTREDALRAAGKAPGNQTEAQKK